jgi:hypothetical protein
MTDQTTERPPPPHPSGAVLAYGGLEFDVTFRAPSGATLRVLGDVDGRPTELLRFDDFVDGPHYHVPADGPSLAFDRQELGVPLDWFMDQLRDHLEQLLTRAGFAAVVAHLDLQAVAQHVDDIKGAMEDCVPEGFVRVPGVGLERAPA